MIAVLIIHIFITTAFEKIDLEERMIPSYRLFFCHHMLFGEILRSRRIMSLMCKSVTDESAEYVDSLSNICDNFLNRKADFNILDTFHVFSPVLWSQ